MHGAHLQRRAAAASAKGKKGAAIRWARDRERRDSLALLDSVKIGDVVRRVIVIDRELHQREAVIYSHDSEREARRKLRRVLGASPPAKSS